MRQAVRAGLAAAVLGTVAWAAPLGAQAPEVTLTVTPEQAGIGAGYQIRVTGCAERPTVVVRSQFSDTASLSELPDDEGGGTWSYSGGRVGTEDLLVGLEAPQCGLTTGLSGRVDVDNPQIVPGPLGSDEPDVLFGTDCPDGTVAAILVSSSDGSVPYEEAIDAYGDWTFELPEITEPGDVVVEAGCGSVTYDPYTYVIADLAEPPGGPPPAPPAAPPAAAVPAPARFTG